MIFGALAGMSNSSHTTDEGFCHCFEANAPGRAKDFDYQNYPCGKLRVATHNTCQQTPASKPHHLQLIARKKPEARRWTAKYDSPFPDMILEGRVPAQASTNIHCIRLATMQGHERALSLILNPCRPNCSKCKALTRSPCMAVPAKHGTNPH